MTVRIPQLSFTSMYLLLLVLDPGGGAVGDPLLTIGLPIIAVAVLAILTVLATIRLLTLFYRRLAFVIIIAVVRMLCLEYFYIHNLSVHLQVIVYTASLPLSGED